MSQPLNEVMEFDHVIEVHEDGSITSPPWLHPLTLLDDELSGGDGKWELLDGYSGQHGYSGPIMHNSEYIGGRIERDILARPGYYVALLSYYSTVPCKRCGEPVTADEGGVWRDSDGLSTCPVNADHAADPEDNVEGWAVAYRPKED